MSFVNSASPFAIDVPQSLLADARDGRMAAFERLYRLFERPTFTLALRMLGDREEAEEVMHDALLKAFQGISGFRGDAPFWGWLRRIASNEVLMRLRKGSRMTYLDEVPEDDDAHPPAMLPPDAAEAGRLGQAMAGLPAATRSVLWLYHVEGHTHKEIAELMQRTPSFSKSQLARGTRRLREMLEVQTHATA